MDATRLRPHRHLLRRGIAAILAFTVPAFGVLLFLTVPNGPWGVVVAGEVVALLLLALAIYRYERLGIWVDVAGIAERGFFFSRSRVPLDQLAAIIRADTFHGGGPETVPQLFVCGADGRQLVRMRGQFWSLESMETVVATLDVPVTRVGHPVSAAELHSTYPGLLYWFERRPLLAGLIFGGTLVVGAAALYLLLVLLGAAI